jgi:AraC-like DNA-binding protein
MKVLTRAYPRATNGTEANGHAYIRNGNSIATVTARSVGQAELSSNGIKPRNGNAATQFASTLTEAPRRGFLPIAAGRSENGSGLPERALSGKEIIFFYCVKGSGWCEIDGKRRPIMPCQLFVAPARVQRTYGADKEVSWSLIWIQLAAVNMDAFIAELIETPQIATLGTWEKSQMLALFHEVLQALEIPSPQRSAQVSQMATHLLENSFSNQHKNWEPETDSAGRIGRTIEFMKEHLNEPLRAATLAGVANMSLPHYFAQFKRVIGGSPIDYLIKLRMEHARRLLSETSWSVKEVAVSLGYDDPLYFSRVFKSINQTAPSDFRARKRGEERG